MTRIPEITIVFSDKFWESSWAQPAVANNETSVPKKNKANVLLVKFIARKIYYDQLFVKEPGTDAPTRWHNDQPYWPVRGWPIVSFWLALDPVTKVSGALEFVRGSHLWNQWFQPEPFAEGGAPYPRNPEYVDIPDIDAERDQHEFLTWEMKPGDLIAFHALTVHGGPPNRSAGRRRGYTVRYCGPGMTYYAKPGTSHFLHDPALEHGAPIEGARYPVVWSR